MATVDLTLTEREEKKIHRPDEDWPDDFALKVVVQDYQSSSNYLVNSHHPRWRDSDELYHAWGEKKLWEGTRIPRANIPVFLVFKQVESLMPRFMDLFADYPWADAEAYPGTTAEQARQHRDLALFQFDQAQGKAACRRAFKSALIRGNGFIEVGYEHLVTRRKRYLPQWVPTIRGLMPTPEGIVPIPGPPQRRIQEVNDVETINRPYLKYLSLWDCYPDPNIESPILQEGRFFIKRALVTLDYLEKLRQQPKDEGFNIPPRQELLELLLKRHSTQGDESKRSADAILGVDRSPMNDTSADPGSKKLEILNYTTADRNVWALEREHVIYNWPNRYGQINYFNAFYTDVLDACYSLSVADVIEGDQRLQRSLIEARLNELSLGIHRQVNKKRGTATPAYQQRRRPGGVREMENPREDWIELDVANITQQAFMEVAASDLRSQQTTSVTDQAGYGTAPSGGNAATRTATGSTIQAGAAKGRHGYTVETTESEFMEPILNFMAEMNSLFLDPETKIQFLGQQGEQTIEDPTQIINSRVKFRLHASARIRAKAGLSQALPLIFQSVLNPEAMAQMRQSGKKLNWQAIMDMIADGADFRPRSELWLDMSPQEMEMLNQPPPEEVLRMQMQRERLQSADGNAEKKGMYDLIKEIVKQEMQARNAPEPKSAGV